MEQARGRGQETCPLAPVASGEKCSHSPDASKLEPDPQEAACKVGKKNPFRKRQGDGHFYSAGLTPTNTCFPVGYSRWVSWTQASRLSGLGVWGGLSLWGLKIGVLNVGFKLSVSQGEARSLRSLLGAWHCARSGVYGGCVSASPAVLM